MIPNPNIHVIPVKGGLVALVCKTCQGREEHKAPSDVAGFMYLTSDFGGRHKTCKPTEAP